MAKPGLRHLAPSLILGLAPAASADAQDLPDPLPALPPAAGAPVVIAPPAGVLVAPPLVSGPPWGPPPVDPAAVARKRPKFLQHKRESFHWRRLQGKMLGYPEDFQPRPLGDALYDHGRVMVANGAATRNALLRYDFIAGTDQLNPRGLDQLARHAARMAENPFPLFIEPTPEQPGLAESRRLAVLGASASWPIPLAPERVVIGLPRANGLSGIDAQIISANAMERTREYGPPIPINSNGVNSPSGVTGR